MRINRVFVCFGQSNAGDAADFDNATSPTVDGYEGSGAGEEVHVRIARDLVGGQDSWRRLECRGPTSIKRFGPELALGHDAYAARGTTENIWIVHAYESGTSLYGDWDPAAVSGKMLYSKLLTFYSAQIALIEANANTPGDVILSGAVWTQGEADGNNSTNATAYQANLLALIDAFGTDFGSCPFIVNRLGNAQTAVAELATVQASQDAAVAARANAYIHNTNSYTTNGDNLHWDANSQLLMGSADYTLIETANGW